MGKKKTIKPEWYKKRNLRKDISFWLELLGLFFPVRVFWTALPGTDLERKMWAGSKLRWDCRSSPGWDFWLQVLPFAFYSVSCFQPHKNTHTVWSDLELSKRNYVLLFMLFHQVKALSNTLTNKYICYI